MRWHSRLHSRGYGAKGDHWAARQLELWDMDWLQSGGQMAGRCVVSQNDGGNLPDNNNSDGHGQSFSGITLV